MFSFRRLIALVVFPIIWALLVFLSLQTDTLVSQDDYSVCGPWGCGPGTGALVAIHAGWLAAMGSPMVFLSLFGNMSRMFWKRIAMGLIALGLIGMLGVVVWQWFVWLPQAGSWASDYFWQRCGFAIVTLVDVPLVPSFLLGAVLAIITAFRPVARVCPESSLEMKP